jgi:hypothetical protein
MFDAKTSPLTWRCHVCGEVRPDAAISVATRPRPEVFEGCSENVRYCNDRTWCKTEVANVYHLAPVPPGGRRSVVIVAGYIAVGAAVGIISAWRLYVYMVAAVKDLYDPYEAIGYGVIIAVIWPLVLAVYLAVFTKRAVLGGRQ